MLHYLVMWTACTKNCCQATVSMTTHHQSYAKIFLCFTSPKIRRKWSEDIGNDEEEAVHLPVNTCSLQPICLTFENPITACQWGLPCSHHTDCGLSSIKYLQSAVFQQHSTRLHHVKQFDFLNAMQWLHCQMCGLLITQTWIQLTRRFWQGQTHPQVFTLSIPRL